MHVIHHLYGAEHDFPVWNGRPRKTYMLATIPRSGSTYFAIRLWQTGLLGAPMEYLNLPIMARLFQRLGEPPLEDYWRSTMSLRTSPNGVFGYKMFMSNYLDISRRHREFLQRITPDHVIYLSRENVVAQAVSYSRAIQTRAWFAGVHEAQPPAYRYGHIRECENMILGQRAFWEDVFALTQTVPVRVSYEALQADAEATLQTVATAIGEPWTAAAAIAVPTIARQSDGLSAEWCQRYVEDREQAGSAPALVPEEGPAVSALSASPA